MNFLNFMCSLKLLDLALCWEGGEYASKATLSSVVHWYWQIVPRRLQWKGKF